MHKLNIMTNLIYYGNFFWTYNKYKNKVVAFD